MCAFYIFTTNCRQKDMPSLKSIIYTLSLLSLSLASPGDRLPEFKSCVDYCQLKTCPEQILFDSPVASTNLPIDLQIQLNNHYFTPQPLPFYLRLFSWNCESNCDFECQWFITNDRILKNEEIFQFHGKWPFIRFWGINEPASCIFSIANFWAQYWGFKHIWNKIGKYKLRSKSRSTSINNLNDDINVWKYYLFVSCVGMNAWVWSTIFHCRDYVWTERMDYFSAWAAVMSGFYISVIRLFRLDKAENKLPRYIITIGCLIAFLAHIYRLQFIEWGYVYNMTVNCIVGFSQYAVWIGLSLYTYYKLEYDTPESKRPQKSNNWCLLPLAVVGTMLFSMSFEIFDFPPIWFTFDAHALWHLATVFPTIWWFKWMVHDYKYLTTMKSIKE